MGVNERHDDRSHKSWYAPYPVERLRVDLNRFQKLQLLYVKFVTCRVELLMMMIGNTVDCERVTGAVFNSRSQCDKMSVWLKTMSDKDYVMYIGYAFKNVVNGVFDMGLNLKVHVAVAQSLFCRHRQ